MCLRSPPGANGAKENIRLRGRRTFTSEVLRCDLDFAGGKRTPPERLECVVSEVPRRESTVTHEVRMPGQGAGGLVTTHTEMARARVLVAIPCLNEGATIGSVVLMAKQHADEVVVVDDGSTDETAEVAELAGAKVLRHARNLGKGMAIRTAWLYAREWGPDALVLMDGDHQHDAGDIPRLTERILSDDADVVIGVRWGKTSGMPIYRRIGKRVLDYATAIGVKNGKVTDSQSGYRVFSNATLFAIEPTENGLSIESQMLLEAVEKELRIDEVNVDFDYRVDGSTLTPGKHGTSVLSRVITLVSWKRPLLIFGISGAILLTIAAGLSALVLATYYATRQLAIGYTFIVILFGIVGILSIFIGITLNALKGIAARQ